MIETNHWTLGIPASQTKEETSVPLRHKAPVESDCGPAAGHGSGAHRASDLRGDPARLVWEDVLEMGGGTAAYDLTTSHDLDTRSPPTVDFVGNRQNTNGGVPGNNFPTFLFNFPEWGMFFFPHTSLPLSHSHTSRSPARPSDTHVHRHLGRRRPGPAQVAACRIPLGRTWPLKKCAQNIRALRNFLFCQILKLGAREFRKKRASVNFPKHFFFWVCEVVCRRSYTKMHDVVV